MPYILLTVAVIILDQGIKWLIQTRMQLFESYPIWDGMVSLTYAGNNGAAFNILQGRSKLLALIAVVVFLVIWFKRRDIARYPRFFKVGLALALGGAVGNFIDRVRLGFVVDYVDFHIWPVFNLADAAILCGAALIILGFLRNDVKDN
ncbi:MAG TPA: signal peptidase II [Bacillota bacterium]